MKKRIMSLLLILSMVLNITPVIALADDAHVHCVCGKTTTCGGSHNADTTWTSVSSLGEITTAGNYYLENDISFSNAWVCSIAGVNICLNGHALTYTGGGLYGQGGIKVDMGANLTITDCKASGTITSRGNYGFYIEGTLTLWNGNITNCYYNGVYNVGGTFTMNGGSITENNTSGVANYDGGMFTMNGGNITGNNVKLISTYGGGVHNKGMFTMTGGTISGNSARNGGGVCNEGTFTIIGGTISGNVYLPIGKTLTAENYKPLTEGATIGVTTESTPTAGNPVVITSGNADKKYFRSDVDTYDVGTDNNGRVVLQVHSFGGDYLHDETGHWQVCQNDGCTVTTEKAAHSGLTWQSENGEYWQKCQNCDHETAKKAIPLLKINGSNRVCKTQDYVFTFTLPEELSSPEGGYEFPMVGSNITITEQDGVYTGTVEAGWYDLTESSFNVYILAKTDDDFVVRAEKIVTILQDHIGGEATCTEKAKCEVCGVEYGDIDPNNHLSLKKIPAKAATKTEEGNIEHWHCEDCGKYYADEGAEKELTKDEITIAKLSSSPTTGDNGSIALWSILVIACASVCITLEAKKKKTANKNG